MSYVKNSWSTGTIITATAMNNMETGIETPNKAIEVVNGTVYLKDSSGNLVSIDTVLSQYTCFRGDTTYVTMYDGSKKLIKDIKIGDSLLGYNVNTKETCETIVLSNIQTGREKYFDCYVFGDGSTLDIYGNDTLLAKTENQQGNKDADEDGVILDCYFASTLVNKFDEGDDNTYVIKEDGSAVYAVCSFKERLKEYTPRFALYTSNGTAFVNGLCLCNVPNDIFELRERRNIQFTQEINEILDIIATEMSELDESLPDTTIINPSKINDIKEYAKALAEISVYKKKLNELDYYTNKHLEGELTEEEWNEIHATRDTYRDKVNIAEAKWAEYKAKIIENNPQVLGYSSTENQKWKRVQAILDAHIEDFRAWALDWNRTLELEEEVIEEDAVIAVIGEENSEGGEENGL